MKRKGIVYIIGFSECHKVFGGWFLASSRAAIRISDGQKFLLVKRNPVDYEIHFVKANLLGYIYRTVKITVRWIEFPFMMLLMRKFIREERRKDAISPYHRISVWSLRKFLYPSV